MQDCHWETPASWHSLVYLVFLGQNRIKCHCFTSAPPGCPPWVLLRWGGNSPTRNDKWTLKGEMWWDTREAKPTNSANSGIFMRRRSPGVSHKPFLVSEIPATCTWRLLNGVNQQSVGPPQGHSHAPKKVCTFLTLRWVVFLDRWATPCKCTG